MSLPARGVTNTVRVLHQVWLHFVAACTACVCLNVQLSFNYQASESCSFVQ